MNLYQGKVCDYCDFNMIIPRKYLNKYIEKNLKSHYKIEGLCRISELADDYVMVYHNNLYNQLNHFPRLTKSEFLIKQFLHYQKGTDIYSGFNCGLCDKKSCNFHFIYSNFIFYKCKNCNSTTNICGWCQEETPVNFYCIKCDDHKDDMFI